MRVLSTIAIALAFALPTAAEVTVIHGINGTDLGFDEALTVDVNANGICIEDLSFRDQLPTGLPAGRYDIAISLAGGEEGDGCTGAVAVSGVIDIALTEDATIIAHLNEEGAPALTKYSNDIGDTDHNRARVSVRHAAAAPPVRVLFKRWRFPNALLPLDNPGSRTVALRAGDYDVQVFDDQRGLLPMPLTGMIPLTFPMNTYSIAYAVGSVDNGTFELLFQAIPIEVE